MIWLNMLLGFITGHWLDLLIIAVVVIALVLLWKRGYKTQVKSVLRFLVAKAEQQFGSKTGQIKFESVYASLPFIVKFFFTQDELRQEIELALVWVNAQLKEKNANLLPLSKEHVDPGGHEEFDS